MIRPPNSLPEERKEARKQVETWFKKLSAEAQDKISEHDKEALINTVLWVIYRTTDQPSEEGEWEDDS